MHSRDKTTRVLYLINDLGLGGAQRVLLSQSAGLDRSRWAPAVASLEIAPGGALIGAFERAGIAVHRLRRAHEPAAIAAVRLPRLIRRIAPDVVHTHLAAAGVAGRVAARHAGVPRIVSTQHNLSDWQERRGHPLRRLERGTLPLADGVIAVSDAVRAALVAACPRLAGRTRTIHNGVAVERFAECRREGARRREARVRASDDFVVGAVARLERRKGVDTLIAAAGQAVGSCPGLRLLIVGDGIERRALESLARASGLGDRVRWAGHQEDVRPFLAAMDVLAMPSRSEGLGLAVIEALAAGVPVVASEVGGIPELLRGTEAGMLIPADDVAAWARMIVTLGADAARRARMAAAGPAHALRFSDHAAATALEALYDELLELRAVDAARAA
jgi:glycosyltransferase involved in cell wall biosynthesis